MISASESIRCDRRFRWLSSFKGNERLLSDLNARMNWFYGQLDGRSLYQEMLDDQEEEPSSDAVRVEMPKYLCALNPETVLEVGCANGRLYRQLRRYGYAGEYFGLEVADFLIKKNKARHAEVSWNCGSAYEIPFEDDRFDACFSFFVLEHLVYPTKALSEMMRVLKPGGRLVLVFPDFAESGRFPSQLLGFSPGRASQKLRTGKLINAFVSLYDSRVRLPRALKKAAEKIGPFPVNTQPLCLAFPSVMEPDVDAIYISSKAEVRDWAIRNGYSVSFPCGTSGEFAEHAFMAITK
jgi:ubiquinone/menaquinone biosynthesis C-methylase UbiE